MMSKRLSANLKKVVDQIGEAATRSGRRPEQITLVAVTKSVGTEVIRQLVELGQVDLAENRVQAHPPRVRSHVSGSRARGPPPSVGARTWNSMWGPSGVPAPPTVPTTWPG